ncbi:MAG: AAA family ATPase, partial [Vicinamibacterales bacterium]
MGSEDPSLHFGPFTLDGAADVLFKEGEPVALRPQGVRLLRYLAERAGRVVTKQELLDGVWQGVVTTEGVLKTTLSQVRQALGDDGDREIFIRTFHRRGYQFAASVERGARERSRGRQAAPDDAGATGPAVDDSQLIGRGEALASLQAELTATLQGRGSPILLAADAGGGKTQLARHFLRWAEHGGARVLYTRFFDYSASRLAPFEVFVDVLRSALDASAESGAPDLMTLLRSQGGQALVDALSEPSQPATGGVRSRTLLQDEFRAIGPLSRAFVRLSRIQPTVLALDDLQWSSDADRDLLAHLITASQGEPLLVLGIVRAEDLRDEASDVVRWLRRRGASRAFINVTLEPWTLDESTRAVRAALHLDPEAALPIDPAALHRLTGGNPYFVMEMLRSRTEAQGSGPAVQGRRRGHDEGLSLPATLALVSGDRLDRLSAPVRALVDRAAVLGDEFRATTLADVAGVPVEDVDERLQDAVRGSVLSTQLVSAGEDYRFHHTILRRVAYDRLPPRVRRDLHRRAAEALQAAYADQRDRVATAISAHYEAADRPRDTLGWALHAWRAARARWRWPDALVSIERAERAAARLADAGATLSPEDAVNLRFGIGERFALRGDLPRSAEVLRQAAAEAERTGQRALLAAILLQSAATLAGLSVYEAAIEAAERARAIWLELGDEERADQATIQWAAAWIAIGRHQEAAARLDAILTAGRASQAVTTAAALMVGWMRALQGQPAEAERLLERALRGYEAIADSRGHALALRRLHWVALARGEYQRAYALAHQARLEYRSVDDAVGEAKLQMGMGQARLGQGLYREGLDLLRRTYESMQTIGDAHCEAETLWLMGRARLGLGELAESQALLDDALDRVRR